MSLLILKFLSRWGELSLLGKPYYDTEKPYYCRALVRCLFGLGQLLNLGVGAERGGGDACFPFFYCAQHRV